MTFNQVLSFIPDSLGYVIGSLAGGVRRGFVSLGYDASDRNRHHAYLPAGRSSPRDEDSMLGTYDLTMLRQHCINLYRNDPVVYGISERISDNVVGSGIMPQAKTKDKSWNRDAEQYFTEWAKIADLRQRVSLWGMQRNVCTERLIRGDSVFVLTSGGQLQPVEAERIVTPYDLLKDPSVVNGFKLDRKTGIIVGAYIFERQSDGSINAQSKDFEYVRRENMIMCKHLIRFDQIRSVPELAPVINMLRDLKSLQEATLEKAKIEAFQAFQIKKDGAGGPGNLGARSSTTPSIGSVQPQRLESGTVYYFRPGESAETIGGATPHSQYDSYIERLLRMIGTALGLPYEFVQLDFSNGSFSSSRAAMLQTYRTFTAWQDWLSYEFLQPIWNWRIAKAIKAGDLSPAPIGDNGVSEWYKVQWSYPEFGWIDPNSEAISEQREVALGKKSYSAIVRKTGRDIEDVLAEKTNDISLAMEQARILNEQYPGQSFTWEHLLSTNPNGAIANPGKVVGTTTKLDGDEKVL